MALTGNKKLFKGIFKDILKRKNLPKQERDILERAMAKPSAYFSRPPVAGASMTVPANPNTFGASMVMEAKPYSDLDKSARKKARGPGRSDLVEEKPKPKKPDPKTAKREIQF
ncbi:MAG: hypothetical protein KAS39_05275 [Actinomycetia bacterium]|nr:hypothetical protein [Actinomycetes bacterium]